MEYTDCFIAIFWILTIIVKRLWKSCRKGKSSLEKIIKQEYILLDSLSLIIALSVLRIGIIKN